MLGKQLETFLKWTSMTATKRRQLGSTFRSLKNSLKVIDEDHLPSPKLNSAHTHGSVSAVVTAAQQVGGCIICCNNGMVNAGGWSFQFYFQAQVTWTQCWSFSAGGRPLTIMWLSLTQFICERKLDRSMFLNWCVKQEGERKGIFILKKERTSPLALFILAL